MDNFNIGLLAIIIVNILSFVVILLVVEGGTEILKELATYPIETSEDTEQVAKTVKENATEQTSEPSGIYNSIKEFFMYDLTVTQILTFIVIIIPFLVLINLVLNKERYLRFWKEHKDKKKEELLKKENSGYVAYLISLQISEKLDYLVTSDGKPRMFHSSKHKVYKSNDTFKQIKKMLNEIQAVYIALMKENNLKMNRYEENLNTLLQTIEKSEQVNMLDNHKVLEGIFSTVKYIHKDIVGSVEETITNDLQRDFEITRKILERYNK